MWKHFIILLAIFWLSAHSAVIDPIKEVSIDCDPNDYNSEHNVFLECFLMEVTSSKDKVAVISSSVDMNSIRSEEKRITVEIAGNVNYPEHFPINLASKFAGATHLTYKQTPLKYVKREDFKHFGSKLRLLLLEENDIEELPFDVFYDLTNLQYLDVSDNRLKKLDTRLFANSPHFTSLFVRSNELSELQPDLLNNCPEFFVLYAEFNKIEEFHQDLFKNNPNMAVISMRHNKIKNIPIDFNRFKNLGVADFTHNGGTCDTMFFEYRPYVEYYNDEEQKKWIKTVPDFQKKVEQECRQ